MKRKPLARIAITQRVEIATYVAQSGGSLHQKSEQQTSERRDCLDQRWWPFLEACGLLPVILPNHLPMAKQILQENPVQGILLTGGNDVASVAPEQRVTERDEVEAFLVEYAKKQGIPLIGVCRGMQLLQTLHGVKLQPVKGHVSVELSVEVEGRPRRINSYHRWGTRTVGNDFESWAVAKDGVIKAIRHREAPLWGIMWHPERNTPADPVDIQWFQNIVYSTERKKSA